MFSVSFFKLEFREHYRTLNQTIFKLFTSGCFSKCEIARVIGHSEHLVRDRVSKMARWSLLEQAHRTKDVSINEAVAYDGLENFSYSQFDPNNINHAIGKNTYFTYDFNFAPINRKGKMNLEQKLRKKELEEKYGKYPSNILRTTTRSLLGRLVNRCDGGELVLYSDEHFQYKRAIERDLAKKSIVHKTISSKACRNFQNPLFPVNNFDIQIRQKSAPFSRETISFSKTSIAMIESFVLTIIQRNYMRPIFYNKQVRDQTIHKESPAMRLGVCDRILSFRDFFSLRKTASQVRLNSDWLNYFKKIDPLSRRLITPNFSI